MRKTLRQEGLVDQRALEELSISIVDDGVSEDILEEAILIANQLGIPDSQLNPSEGECDFTIFLGESYPADPSIPFCRVQLLDDGFRVTDRIDSEGGKPSPLQRPGLRTIACSVAWQEVIRRTGVSLPIEVPKKYLDICLRVDPKSLPSGEDLNDLIDIKQNDSSPIPFQVIPREDGRGHALLKLRVEEGSSLADSVFSKLQICWQEESQQEPCHTELRLPRAEGPISGSATFPGIGGLGSWAVKTIVDGITETGSNGQGLTLNLIDPDTEIEEHNLNRQVLYSEADIGREKATVAGRLLSEALPSAEVHSRVGSVGLPHLFEMDFLSDRQTLEFEEEEDPIFATLEESGPDVSSMISASDILICGVDNLRDRSILNAISSKLGMPMVNAGAQGFSGQFDLFMPEESCMLCRYGIGAVNETIRMSCQEDGEVPFSSIVTSTAIFGALEGLALLTLLSGGTEKLSKWPTHISWNGRKNSFQSMSDNGLFSQSFSLEGPHRTHLFNRLTSGSHG
tara:strand:- start:336 stop:1871 length:1536 start_codon:yes stop_codon:yes gene_type:complete